MGKSNEKEKVYCGTCKHIYKGDGVFYCLHVDNKSNKDTPLEIKVEYRTIQEANANNDCKLYKKGKI